MSSLESFNQQLFLQLNASSNTMTATAESASFVADYVLYLIPLFLVVYWIIGDTTKKQIALKSVAVTMWLVAWSRIYLGVHFPFDMLGAFGLAMVVTLLVEVRWKHLGERVAHPFIEVYEIIFNAFIKFI